MMDKFINKNGEFLTKIYGDKNDLLSKVSIGRKLATKYLNLSLKSLS